MTSVIEQWDLSQMLQPVQGPEDARQDALKFGVNLTVPKGCAIGIKTSDKLAYPMVPGASDGTQNFVGFAGFSFVTDATGQIFQGTSITAAGNFRLSPFTTAMVYTSGIFDPQDLVTKGTAAAEVDTFTPTNPTTADVYTLTYVTPAGVVTSVSATIGATQTAAAAVTLLTTAWNANATMAALGTASGTSTFIVTAKTTGAPLNLIGTVVGTGTFPKALTTNPGIPLGEIDTFLPATVTTGDVHTLTYAGGPGTPQTASFTVGATQTVAAVIAGLIAAWNANPTLAAVGIPFSGVTYLGILAKNAGTALGTTSAVVGTGTLVKTTYLAASGRAIADIQVGRPGACVLHNGFWKV